MNDITHQHTYCEVEKKKIGRGLKSSFIDSLLAKSEITQVARSLGLKLNKKNYCRCPFHTERTPSFSINVDKQYYYCFGCGASGRAFEMVKDMKGVNDIQAAFYLKKICGIEDKLEFENRYYEILNEFDTGEEEVSLEEYTYYAAGECAQVLSDDFENTHFENISGTNAIEQELCQEQHKSHDDLCGKNLKGEKEYSTAEQAQEELRQEDLREK